MSESNETFDIGSKVLTVGQQFASFKDVETAMRNLEEEQKIVYRKRDSRTYKAAKKRVNIPENPALIYYELKYACIKKTPRNSQKSPEDKVASRLD